VEDLKDKVILITGGSRGIGKACCETFARQHASVIFTYKDSSQKALSLEKELKRINSNCLKIKSDVRNFKECKQTVDTVLEKFKKIDILINNAGITKDKSLVMMELSEWQKVIDTNLTGTFNMTKAAIFTFLKQKSGCIINISSTSGIVGVAGQTNYCASKAGIIGFTKALSKEISSYNIKVNAVCPGYIDTDMINQTPKRFREQILQNIPAKRLGTAQEVAEFCLLLCLYPGNYLTGEAIRIDGGLIS
jgi:3-oxoacyl-[acyl-carrier protein] reductase